jgi:hypothetical protein
MNPTAFYPNSEAVFDLFKKRFICDGNALGPLSFPNNPRWWSLVINSPTGNSRIR